MVFFIFGLFLGSFLNNIAFRLEKNQEFPWLRSRCPSCKKILRWYELIPVLSFLIQKGKCRHCQSKISLRYPLTEIITGIWVFLLARSLNTQLTFFSLLEFFFYLTFLSILFILALYDLKTFLVDDRFIYFGIFIAVLFLIVKSYFHFIPRDFSYLFNYFFSFGKFEPIFSAIILSSFFGLIYLLTKGKGIGFGDVEVAFLIGLFLRPGDALLTVIISSFFGSLYGLYILLKTKKLKQPIPFVPFLFLGTILTISFGYPITNFYFKIFGL